MKRKREQRGTLDMIAPVQARLTRALSLILAPANPYYAVNKIGQQPRIGEIQMSGKPFEEVAKPKEFAKEKEAIKEKDKEAIKEKDKEHSKVEADKLHKDQKDSKEHKEQKDKQEKEKLEKENKEKQEKESKEKQEKNEPKEKHEKEKHEKEIKDRKDILPKELAKEKEAVKEPKEFKELELSGKQQVDTPASVGFGGDPLTQQRIAMLEASVAQLLHFIPATLRPDLTTGALSQEPDAAAPDGPSGDATGSTGESKPPGTSE